MKHAETTRFTPNRSIGKNKPLAIVLHHSGGNYEGGVAWILNPESKVSYHCLIGTNGERTVFATGNDVCWHAGKSRMTIDGTSYAGCNHYSIGISWTGDTHKRRWTDGEIDSAVEYARNVMAQYSIKHVFTHADIATPKGRKTDCNKSWYEEFMKRLNEANNARV